MNEAQKKFNEFVKKQEQYFLEFVSIHQQLADYLGSLNKEVETYIENGNVLKEGFHTKNGLFGNHQEGEGYFKMVGLPSHFFRDYATEIIEAQKLFIERLKNEFQRLFGTFEIFCPLSLDYDFFREKKVYHASDILDWIQKEISGERIQDYYKNKDSFVQNGKKVSLKDFSWDKNEDNSSYLYAPSNYHALFGALSLVEFGSTDYKEIYGELQELIQDTHVDVIRNPFPIDDSKIVESIRFYQNGKVEIYFSSKEEAVKFFSFVTEKQQIAN